MMSERAPLKIIHLSDTHVGFKDNVVRFERIADDIVKNHDPVLHLIIHTGDLIDTESDTKNRDEAMRVLQKLGKHGFRIFMCPGNHDYGNGTGMYMDRALNFRTEFEKYLFPGLKKEFPTKTEFNSYVFIGLDSCFAELKFWESWFAEGYIGDEQLRALDEMLVEEKEKTIVLYLHHHPFSYSYTVRPGFYDRQWGFHEITALTRSFRRLKDAYSLIQIIRDRVQVLLFGHMHCGLDCSAQSREYGIPLGFDASSSTCTNMDTDRIRYRIIDLQNMSVETRFVS